jgi:LysM repeat protein
MKRLFLSILLSTLIVACQGVQPQGSATPTSTLRPYLRTTSTPTLATRAVDPATAPPLGPTATPWVHVIQSGDTLLGIAARYGVDYEDLLIANPGIDPRLLSIGKEILIPGSGGEPITALLPTPTPLPLNLADVRCFGTPSESMWCLTEVWNPSSEAVEGVSVVISLMDPQGERLVSQQVYGPLNLLLEDRGIPLVAYFPDPPSDPYLPAVELLSAVLVSDPSNRYLPVEVTETKRVSMQDGMRWDVSGEVVISDVESVQGAQLSLLLIGFGEGGEMVGYRKWTPGAPIASGDVVPFKLSVFSLGPPIARVELLSEALAIP